MSTYQISPYMDECILHDTLIRVPNNRSHYHAMADHVINYPVGDSKCVLIHRRKARYGEALCHISSASSAARTGGKF